MYLHIYKIENFSLIASLQMKLAMLLKAGRLDACIRPLFANSVTYAVMEFMHKVWYYANVINITYSNAYMSITAENVLNHFH